MIMGVRIRNPSALHGLANLGLPVIAQDQTKILGVRFSEEPLWEKLAKNLAPYVQVIYYIFICTVTFIK